RSSRPGGAVALLDLAPRPRGPRRAPQSPQRSSRPGGAVALLDVARGCAAREQCVRPPSGVSLGTMAELFDHIDELRRSPGKVAVATLVNTRGTTPRKEGAKMLVGEGGSVLGSVTIGGCVDAQVIEKSEDVL